MRSRRRANSYASTSAPPAGESASRVTVSTRKRAPASMLSCTLPKARLGLSRSGLQDAVQGAIERFVQVTLEPDRAEIVILAGDPFQADVRPLLEVLGSSFPLELVVERLPFRE